MAEKSLPNSISIDNLTFALKPGGTRFKDIEGQLFGRLTVIGYKGLVGNHREWYCLCDCGNVTVVFANTLQNGCTKSCGCLNTELSRERRLTHGKSHTRVYKIWKHVIDRCCNPNATGYENYGGRGITVCERWLSSFENFYADMGEPPTTEHSIDRRNSNGNYTPDNCRWATREEQQNNTTRNHFITIHGRTQTLTEWAKESGIPVGTVVSRLRAGKTAEQALEITTGEK